MINKINNFIAVLFKHDLHKLKKGWLYLFISNPQLYFAKLFKHTLLIGLLSLIFSILYNFLELQDHKMPITFHSIIGIVIGLLLVFRTNTAYDRWWEGVKSLNSISTILNFFIIKFRTSVDDHGRFNTQLNTDLKLIMTELKIYLGCDNEIESEKLFKNVLTLCYKIMKLLSELNKNTNLSDRDLIILETSIKDLMTKIEDCKRIKNTPIPIAYALHIKISLIFYVLSLPFGLFHDMGLYSALIVMLTYFIIAGIEIISNEIENPFRGDPNDIPLDSLIQEINNLIDFDFNVKIKVEDKK